MSTSTWFVENCDTKIVEALSQQEILRQWLRGNLPDESRCWQEGMPKWVPIAEVEPLAATMQRLRQVPTLIHFSCDCGNAISMGQKFAGQKVKCKECGTILSVPGISNHRVHITRQKVAEKITAYLQQQLTLAQLVQWAKCQVLEQGLFESLTVRHVVMRLGLSEIRTIGLTWEECQRLMVDLGFSVHVEVVEIVEE